MITWIKRWNIYDEKWHHIDELWIVYEVLLDVLAYYIEHDKGWISAWKVSIYWMLDQKDSLYKFEQNSSSIKKKCEY